MTSSEKEYTHLFKILLIGNSSVGKSSLLLRFVDDAWSDIFVPTIGVDFKVRTLKINNNLIKFQIWDTAGQERFKNITANYYRGAHGILVLYDITDIDSFKNLNNWLMEIEKNANSNIVKILIGNKSDLSNMRKVSFQEGEDFAEEKGGDAGGQTTDILGREGLNQIGFRDYRAGSHGEVGACCSDSLDVVRRNVF